MREHSITEPCRTEKNFRQFLHRNGNGLQFAFAIVFELPHFGHFRSSGFGQRTPSNHLAAASSVGNICINSMSVIPLRSDLPGALAISFYYYMRRF